MSLYCPACATGVETDNKQHEGRQVWCCAQCGLVLEQGERTQPAAGDPVLGRIAVAKLTAEEALAQRAAAQKRAEEQAAKLAAKQAARQAGAAASDADGIELAPDDPGEFVLETAGGERAVSTQPKPAPGAAGPAASAAALRAALVADDTALHRELLRDALGRLSAEVVASANGEELLQQATRRLAARAPLDLVVLDLEMPLLNGFQAAIALRAVERGLGVQAPTPILFFSVHPCDATFAKVLEYCKPARYLNKGADGDPRLLAERLAQVLAQLRR